MTARSQAAIDEAVAALASTSEISRRMARQHLSDALTLDGLIGNQLSQGEIDYMNSLSTRLETGETGADVMSAWEANQKSIFAAGVAGAGEAVVSGLGAVGTAASSIFKGATDAAKGALSGLTGLFKSLPLLALVGVGVAVAVLMSRRKTD